MKIGQAGYAMLISLQTVSAATEKQSASIEEIASSCEDLHRLANELSVNLQKLRM